MADTPASWRSPVVDSGFTSARWLSAHLSLTMNSKSKARWITAGLLFGAFVAWSIGVAILIVNQGDGMIGFHPVILATLPGVFVGVISAIIMLVLRRWPIAVALGLGSVMLFLVISNGHAIEEEGWRRAIERNKEVNRRSMASIQNDLQTDDLSALWDEEKLVPVKDFQWFGTNHLSAPDGLYLGFRIGGVPHVRIQKIRHGWKGIALVDSQSDLSTLAARTGMRYSRVDSSDWCVWSTDQ